METHLGSRLVKTLDLSLGGVLYGGRMLDFVAEHAAIRAMKCTGAPHMVGYRFGEIVLSRPVRAGEIIDFSGGEPRFGRSSVTFELTGRVGNEVAVRAECTFVAVDEHGCKKLLERMEK